MIIRRLFSSVVRAGIFHDNLQLQVFPLSQSEFTTNEARRYDVDILDRLSTTDRRGCSHEYRPKLPINVLRAERGFQDIARRSWLSRPFKDWRLSVDTCLPTQVPCICLPEFSRYPLFVPRRYMHIDVADRCPVSSYKRYLRWERSSVTSRNAEFRSTPLFLARVHKRQVSPPLF